MNDKDIQEAKRRLMIERLELKKLLLDLGTEHPDDAYDLDPIADDEFDFDPSESAEVASSLEDYALRVDAEMTLEKRYRDVHAALLSIEAGNYGVCIECDKPIESARLHINPAALYCTKHMEEDSSTSAL